MNKSRLIDKIAAGADISKAAGWYSLVAVALSAEGPRKVYLKSKAVFDRIAGGVMTLLGLKLIFGMK